MKVGILLGSFNPIHMGHLHMAASVLNAGLVDDVVFVPSVQNPWKEKYSVDFRNRCFMISLAIDDMEHCSLSSIDYRNTEPYYSVNTLRMLQEEYPEVIQILCSDFKGEVISVSKVQKNNIEQNFNKNQENTIEERHEEVENNEF